MSKLVHHHHHHLTKIFENNKISISTKTSAFKTYIDSIFLYNSETWTSTKQLNAQIDSFQRRLIIRKFILNVKWPDNEYVQGKLLAGKNGVFSKNSVERKEENKMAVHAHMSHEVVPDALPYVDQGYDELGVREMVSIIHDIDCNTSNYFTYVKIYCFI